MWTVSYFSEGVGALWLLFGAVAVLVALGVAVRFSRYRVYLGNILVAACMAALDLIFLL